MNSAIIPPTHNGEIPNQLIGLLGKRGQLLWISSDPNKPYNRDMIELYHDDDKEKVLKARFRCLIEGKVATYSARATPFWGGQQRTWRCTMLPADLGEVSAVAIATPVPIELREEEIEILRLMAEDQSLKEIATTTHRSISAIDSRVAALKEKLGCKTLSGLTAKAVRFYL